MFPQLPWLTPWKNLSSILAANVSDATEVLLVQGAGNFRITIAQLKLLLGGVGGGGVGAGEMLLKAGINGELINAAAFRAALGIDSLNFVDALPVANQAARLALTADQARNVLVKEADTGRGYMLVANGVPATSGDWILFTDITVAMADIAGLEAALLAKAGINGELINAPAFRTALGLDTLNIVDVVPVANAAARLALAANAARNALVRETDTGISYMLISGGVPGNSGDWLKVADTTPTISDIVGLSTELSTLNNRVAAVEPSISETPPSDGVFAILIDAAVVTYGNGLYMQSQTVVNGRSVFGFNDPDTEYNSANHFIYDGTRWELMRVVDGIPGTATVIAYSTPTAVERPDLVDLADWTADNGYQIWGSGEISTQQVGADYNAAGVWRTYDTVYVLTYDEDAFIRWVPITRSGWPMNSRGAFFPANFNGYERFVLAGTTIPSTTGHVLLEVQKTVTEPANTWTTTGVFGVGLPPDDSLWVAVYRLPSGAWRLDIYLNSALSQRWDGEAAPKPSDVATWVRVSGSASAGPVVNRSYYAGMPGKVGQAYGYDLIIGDERSTSFAYYVCVRESPYYLWTQVATNPSETGLSVIRAASPTAARAALQAMPLDNVILRSAEEGSPNIPDEITISGITDPVSSDPLVLVRGADSAGFPAWHLGDWTLEATGTAWSLADGTNYEATVVSDERIPVGLTGWTVVDGAGSPILTGSPSESGQFVGQLARIGDSEPFLWERWDGFAWVNATATWEAIRPHVIEVDYMATADREGLSIPDGAYGQKSGIPHFGNSPLADQLHRRLSFEAVFAQAFGVGIQSIALGGFIVPASEANDSLVYGFAIDVTLDSSLGGTPPAAGDDIYVLVRLGSGSIDMTQGSWIKLTPTFMYEKRRIRGALSLVSAATLLRPELNTTSQEIIGAATTVADATYYPLAAVDVTNDSTTTVPENQATSFQFYLVGNWTTAGASITSLAGSVELFANNVVVGALE